MKIRKRYVVILLSIACLVLIVGGIWGARFFSSEFRYNFDVLFNCADTHYSYSEIDGEANVVKATLPLPKSTAFAFRHSDTAATYYSKLSYEEFLKYYADEGYIIEDNMIITDSGTFIISDANEPTQDTWKYNFVDIALSE